MADRDLDLDETEKWIAGVQAAVQERWGKVRPGHRLFTPRDNSGERVRMELDYRDSQIVDAWLRQPNATYEITDQTTGKRWLIRTAECSLPGCYCAAEIVREVK
jgi:hypothetical protein